MKKRILIFFGFLFLSASAHAIGNTGIGVHRIKRPAQFPPIVLKVGGGLTVSTIGPCAYAGACYNTGPSTITITAFWADASPASTVTSGSNWTRLDIGFSTGGANGQPTSFRLPLYSLSTGTILASSGFNGVISSSVRVNAGETFTVLATTVPNVGTATQELRVHFNYVINP